jgi:hypothetical protein
MLLTILLGAVGALVVVGGLSLWEAGILAAILSPTDAGLSHICNKPMIVDGKTSPGVRIEHRTQEAKRVRAWSRLPLKKGDENEIHGQL